jgi:hypothetical protein
MFRVQCAINSKFDGEFDTFSIAEEYAKEVARYEPVIWLGSKQLAHIHTDSSQRVWVDLTIDGCNYA